MPRNDGKRLEGLVEFVERTLLPDGFSVKVGEPIYDDDGDQVAELDVQVHGVVGSTQFAWLIECRDRPSDGKAPVSWIEQLATRRGCLGFNKVTAVSTTGFAAGAIKLARQLGIELRSVKSLTQDAFEDWFQVRGFSHVERRAHLLSAGIELDQAADGEILKFAQEFVGTLAGDSPGLLHVLTRKPSSMNDAFLGAVEGAKQFEQLIPNQAAVPIRIRAKYNNDLDHFVIATPSGDARVRSILYIGELSIIERNVAIASKVEYTVDATSKVISQAVMYEPQEFEGGAYSLQIHRILDSGEMHVVVATQKKDKGKKRRRNRRGGV